MPWPKIIHGIMRLSTSGDNQCRYANFSYYKVKGNLNNVLKPYLNNSLQVPSMQTIGDETLWARGITYVTSAVGGNIYLHVPLKGVSNCPKLSGKDASSVNSNFSNGIACFYTVGTRLY